uniref:Uncharacterized protein n=1 Tax=Parascaris equorum TaxID=6256 RepID=A0A914RQY2_PAREQ
MAQMINERASTSIECTIAEYKLLEDMNSVTAQRYDDMKQVASGVATKLSQLNQKCISRRLEEAATILDQYVTSLGSFLLHWKSDYCCSLH